MDVYNINETYKYKAELRICYNYIYYSLQNPIAARHFLNKIKKQISTLQYFPEMYPKLCIGKNENLRKMLIGNYVIIYKVDNFNRSSLYLTYF